MLAIRYSVSLVVLWVYAYMSWVTTYNLERKRATIPVVIPVWLWETVPRLEARVSATKMDGIVMHRKGGTWKRGV